MKILLINPPTPDYIPNKEFILPVSLLSLAAVLRKENIHAQILDLNLHPDANLSGEAPDELLTSVIAAALETLEPSLVGIGCLFSGLFPSVLKLATLIKATRPILPVVIGGMHPTIYPREILTHCRAIDYVVIGEGEEQIVALARAVRAGETLPIHVEGIAFRLGNEVVVNPKVKFIEELDALPLPAYDLVNFDDYRHDTSHWHNPKRQSFSMSVPLISSRSCPMQCSFCSMFLVMGPKLRVRSPSNVVDEIDLLYHRYGQRHFSFMDDNLNLNKKHVLAICDEIRRRRLDIQFETPNGLMVATLDREVMDAMIAAGWVRGAIAIESGSDYIRNTVMRKKLDRVKIHQIARLAKEYAELYLKAYFIIGMPEETLDTLQDTYDMILEIDVDEPYVTNLLPFPGTAVFAQAVRDNLLIEEIDIYNLWQTVGFHYTNNKRFYLKPYAMGLDELQEFRKKFDTMLAELQQRKQSERRQCLKTTSCPQ